LGLAESRGLVVAGGLLGWDRVLRLVPLSFMPPFLATELQKRVIIPRCVREFCLGYALWSRDSWDRKTFVRISYLGVLI